MEPLRLHTPSWVAILEVWGKVSQLTDRTQENKEEKGEQVAFVFC